MTDLHTTLPVWPEPLAEKIRITLIESGRTIVVLDDDPTGTQTVYDVPVLTSFSEDDIRALVESRPPMFFLLTNSRSLSESETERLHRDLAQKLKRVAEQTNQQLEIISRSDSTLRGHFPLETDALVSGWPGLADLTLVMGFFAEGGRLTIEGQHYVVENEKMTPAHETPFAKDPVFSYENSFLPKWIEEKTSGRVAAEKVVSIPLNVIRQNGPDGVQQILDSAPSGSNCVADAATDQDAYVVAAAVGQSSRKIMARTAASYARARAGLTRKPELSADELKDDGKGGLVVVGSHVPKTTTQLNHLRAQMPDIVACELSIDEILTNAEKVVVTTAAMIDQQLTADRNVVVFTSRTLREGDSNEENLSISQSVSKCVANIVARISIRPKYLIGKGGITSSDIATQSLQVKLATVVGSILPGIPVWRLGEESRFPDLNFIVFPGNVGGESALFDAVKKLT